MSAATVLVLRPEPGAGMTCGRADALGVAAVSAPLFTVRPLAWTMPAGRYDAIMATSANALRLGGAAIARLTHLPLYAVGSMTAAAAHAAGFADVRAGAADVAALLSRAAADGLTALLHLAGRDRRDATQAGVSVAVVEVYAADAVPTLPAAAAPALAAGAVALLHSPRAGRVFADLLAGAGIARGEVRIAGISARVIAAAGPGWRAAAAAAAPTDDALLATARGMSG